MKIEWEADVGECCFLSISYLALVSSTERSDLNVASTNWGLLYM